MIPISLGEAFVDVHANTGKFTSELAAQLKAELAKVEAALPGIKLGVNRTRLARDVQASIRFAVREAKFPPLALDVNVARLKREVQAAIRGALRDSTFAPLHLAINADRLKREVQAAIRAALAGASFRALHVSVDGERLRRELQADVRKALRNITFPPIHVPIILSRSGRGAGAGAAAAGAAEASGIAASIAAAVKASESQFRGLSGTGAVAFGNIEASALATARAIVESLDGAVTFSMEEFHRLAVEIAASLHGAVDSGARSFAELEAAAAAAGASIARSIEEGSLGAKVALAEVGAAAQAAGAKTRSAFAGAGAGLNRLGGIAGTVARKLALPFLGTFAAVTFFGLKQASVFDQLNKSFDALQVNVTNVDNALGQNKLLVDLRAIAENTSFAFQGAAKLGQQLLGIGQTTPALALTNDRIKEVVQSVADAGAAVGATPAQISNLAVVLGKTAGSAKLTARELNSVALAIPTATRARVFAQLAVDLGLVDKNAKAGSKELSAAVAKVQELQDKGLISGPQGFQALVKVLQTLPGAAGASARQLDTLGGALQSIKEKIQNRLQDAFGTAAKTIAKALNDPKINGAITGLTTKVGEASAQLVTKLIPALVAFLPVFGSIFSGISTVIIALTPTMIQAFKAVDGFIQSLIRGVRDNLPAIKQFFTELKAALPTGDELSTIVPAIKDFATAVAGISLTILNGIGPALEGVALVAGPAAQILKDIAGALKVVFDNPVGDELFKVAGALAAIVLASKGLAAVELAIVGINSAALTAGAASGGMALLLARFRPFLIAGAVILGLEGVNKAVNKLSGTSDSIGTKVKGAFTDIKLAGGDVYDALVNGAQGTANGITAAINAIPGVHIDNSEFNAAMDNASAKVVGLHETLGALPAVVPVQVRVVITKETRAIAAAAGGGSGFSIATGGQQNGGFGSGVQITQQQQDQVNKENAANAEKSINDALNSLARNTTGGGSRTGGGGGSTKSAAETAAKAAAAALKAAAKKFATDIANIGKSIGIGFVSGITSGTRDEIDSKLTSIEKAVEEAFSKVKSTVDDKLIARIAKDNKALGDLADQRKALADKIKEATDKAASIAAGLVSENDLSNLGLNLVGKDRDKNGPAIAAANAATFDQKLKDRLAKLKKFAADLAKLTKAGLDKNIIAQLAEGGVQSQGGIADALAKGSPKTIASINKTQAEIVKAAGGVGNNTADLLFDAGKNAGKGFLTGLIGQKADIIKAMKDIADALVAQIKKSLKTKSPSQVLRDLGKLAGMGLQVGLDDSLAGVARSAQRMAQAAIPRLSTPSLGDLQGAATSGALAQLRGAGATNNTTFEIQVNGVSDPAAARKAGLLVAAPIADILQRRQDAAALAGTG